jgi:hypothetical protein
VFFVFGTLLLQVFVPEFRREVQHPRRFDIGKVVSRP